ncbi:MAG: hypothetical protein NTX14_03850 [Candidatus Nealsonbacteria bacterium]|nr:hypothetical protein [Candidatus Nealsonbacteria bacterium]
MTFALFETAKKEKPSLVTDREGTLSLTLRQSSEHEPASFRHNEPSGAIWVESFSGKRSAKTFLAPNGMISFVIRDGTSYGSVLGNSIFWIEKPVKKWNGLWINSQHQSQIKLFLDGHVVFALYLVKAFAKKQFG